MKETRRPPADLRDAAGWSELRDVDGQQGRGVAEPHSFLAVARLSDDLLARVRGRDSSQAPYSRKQSPITLEPMTDNVQRFPARRERAVLQWSERSERNRKPHCFLE